jgi:TonB family protein
MSSYGGTVAILCAGVVFADVPSAQPQDATSTNLPEQSETGEPAPPAKSKKKKAERRREVAARAPTQTPTPASEQTPPAEKPVTGATPVEKKARVKRRAPSVVQREMASIPPPIQLSLSAAQAMAVSAPLPEYPYQAKRANITGSGVCVMLVDTVSGNVTNATMTQSTGNRVLDKVTTDTFRRWRFKPGSVSQVRVPVTYE